MPVAKRLFTTLSHNKVNNMLDTILEIAATPDWISPTIALIQTWRNHPSVGFAIPTDTEWNLYAIRELLTCVGVKVWGLALVDHKIIFRVRQAQAAYTQYLLERAGIPYQGGLADTPKTTSQRKNEANQLKPAKGALNSLLDQILELADIL